MATLLRRVISNDMGYINILEGYQENEGIGNYCGAVVVTDKHTHKHTDRTTTVTLAPAPRVK